MMKHYRTINYTILTILAILSVGLQTPQAVAKSQDAIEAAAQAQTSGSLIDAGRGLVEDIQGLIGTVTGFFSDLPGLLGETINGAIGAFGVPDLEEITATLTDSSTAEDDASRLAELLESTQLGEDNQGSYAIRQDMADRATREAAVETMSAATLGQESQQRLKQQAEQAAQATRQNARLAQDSQNSDVTQHIMQNLSQQTALNAQVNQQLLVEAQQGRIDRAINNTLTAQVAEEIAGANIADRRETTATSSVAIRQTGLMSLPGGYYIGQENE